ncbi:hypothetical protein ABK046_48330, partial [Streptomyces caeruleatus]
LSGVQQILFEHVCAVVHDNQWDKFKSYWTGQRVDSPVFLQELLDISNKTRQRGTNIIFIGHMATIDVANSMGPDYMSHVLFMDDG